MRTPRSWLLALAALMVWSVAYLGWTAEWIAWTVPHPVEHAGRRLVLCLFGASLSFAIAAAMDGSRGWRCRDRILGGVGLNLAAVALYSLANYLVFYRFAPLWGPYSWREGLLVAEGGAWVLLLWTTLYFAIQAYGEAYAARLKLAEASQAELRARYQTLTAQTRPHFLFNALNSISALILGREPARAEAVLLALSGLLRATLEADAKPWVRLEEELCNIRKYLWIEGARFAERLNYVETVPSECLSVRVPALILLPLAENVIRHGVSHCSSPVTLTLSAALEAGRLVVEIRDDARPDAGARETPGAGVGQANVRQRLAILHGADAALACGAAAPGYVARVSLPAEGGGDA